MELRIFVLLLVYRTCLAVEESFDSDQNITSPGYPKPFPAHLVKTYLIYLRNRQKEDYLVAYFENFNIVANPLKPNATSLKVEDHHGHVIGTFTTSAPQGFVTKANHEGWTLKLIFKSHVKVNVTVPGFKMYFKRLNATDLGNRNKSSNTSSYVSSPGYPLNYPISSVIVYTIKTPIQDGVIQFVFQDIDLGEGATIEVYDAEVDGTPYLIYTFHYQQGKRWRYYLSGNVMSLVLRTGKKPTHRGFNLTYSEYCQIAGEELPCELIPHSAWTNIMIFVISITGIVACILLLVGCGIYFRR